MRSLFLSFVLCSGVVACSPDPDASGDAGAEAPDSGTDSSDVADAAAAADAGTSTDTDGNFDTGDRGAPTDAGADMTVSDDVGDSDLAVASDFTLAGTLDGVDVAFERAYFGVTSAALTDSGMPELYVEAYAGGVSGCPEQNSPTPDQTMIITNMLLPDESTVANEASGLVVSILDFAGDLPPISRAEGESLEFVDWNCTDCTQDGDTIVFDLDAPMMGGSFSGRVTATHCDSMDE